MGGYGRHKGNPTPFQGLAYTLGDGVRDRRRRARGGGGEGHVMSYTPTPETGLDYLVPVTHPTMLWQVMLTSTP